MKPRFLPRLFTFALLAAAGTVSTAEQVAAESARAARPNIVQIMADDLGWAAVGYNGQRFVKTPHIDRLAEGGMVFRRGYAMPVCSPTRASLQVGFHNGHTWTDWNIRWPAKGFRQRSVTIGKALQQAGYTTGAFGKWGFGGSDGQGRVLRSSPVIDNPTTLPTNQGYNVFYGCLDHVRAHTFFMDSLWKSDPAGPHGLKLVPTGNTDSDMFQRYCDDLYAAHARAFAAEHAGGEQPFYLQLHFQTPHSPLDQIAELDGWFDAYDGADTADWPAAAKQYAAMVTRMDQHIGRLVAQLRDPNDDGDTGDSVLDETLIVFTSDNGGYRGASFVEQFELNGGLRDGKGSVYEGGIRVPMLAYWPGTIPAGSQSDRPVDVTDQLPTFAELAGAAVPAGVDGVSFAPTLTGRGYQRPRDFLAFEARDNWAIVRGSMKLTYHDRGQGRYELYDLAKDPAEQHNLLASGDGGESDERYEALKSKLELEKVALTAGVVHGSAIHRAEARQQGKDAGEPHYVSFPRWSGRGGSDLAKIEHWDFENQPTPQTAWVATVGGRGDEPRTATLAGQLRVLGIEIGSDDASQAVRIERDATLYGINEVRVAGGGQLRLTGGTVGSDRWVNVLPKGKLSGRGQINAAFYNTGQLSANGPLVIRGDYRPSKEATTVVTVWEDATDAPLRVHNGTLHAAGRLTVRLGGGEQPKSGDSVDLFDAETITGQFDKLDLPGLDDGADWDLSKLYDSGVIVVR